MTEWKTIGSTVDYLMEHGGKAENSRGDILEFHLTERMFVKIDNNGNRELATLSKEVLTYNWQIVDKKFVKYVSFIEAMAALKEGKVITLHIRNIEHSFSQENYFRSFVQKGITISDFCNGKWEIHN
jgi:hypothetical protein